MATIIDFEQRLQKKRVEQEQQLQAEMVESVLRDIAKLDEQGKAIGREYAQLMYDNPMHALRQFPQFMQRTREVNTPFGEAAAGGPNHSWTGPMLNTLGTVYPSLDHSKREQGLRYCLRFLDGLNYMHSQNQVEVIQEPWLAADIVISRSIYFPGYDYYCKMAAQHKTWKDFLPQIDSESTRSPFWLAMAVTDPRYTSLDVRTHFYKQFPMLMDHTKDGIAAMVAVYGGRKAEREGLKREDCIRERLVKLHDPLLHEEIYAKIKEEKWVCVEE